MISSYDGYIVVNRLTLFATHSGSFDEVLRDKILLNEHEEENGRNPLTYVVLKNNESTFKLLGDYRKSKQGRLNNESEL